MKQSKLKACTLFAGTAALLLGLGSCNKEPEVAVEEAPLVVEHATVRARVGERGAATKASFDGSVLNWTEGDKVVMVSNGCVNGTLECIDLDGTSGIFEGDVSQFDPEAVKFFFLGNRDVSVINPTFDLSSQRGSMASLVNYLFLAPAAEVKLEKDTENKSTYVLKAGEEVGFNPVPLIPFLELKFGEKEGSPAYENEGVKVKSVVISGLKNQMSLNLTSGEISASSVSGKATTEIKPAQASDYAKTYYLAVVPQDATDVSMQITYYGGSVEQEKWSGINWSIAAGNSYYTDWSKQSLSSLGLVSHAGYGAEDVSGGNGLSNKGGYSGSNADGSVDNPTGDKKGYDGTDVDEK